MQNILGQPRFTPGAFPGNIYKVEKEERNMDIQRFMQWQLMRRLRSRTSWDQKYTMAIRELIEFASIDDASPSYASERRVEKELLALVREGLFPETVQEVMRIVTDGTPGPLVRIPRPSCMERYLPPGRQASPEEFKSAWARCQRIEEGA